MKIKDRRRRRSTPKEREFRRILLMGAARKPAYAWFWGWPDRPIGPGLGRAVATLGKWPELEDAGTAWELERRRN